MDCSPPGSSVHGILQARVLEWGAIAFSNGIARCLILMGAAILFSVGAAPFYILLKDSNCSIFLPTLIFFIFLTVAVLMNVRWCLIVLLIYISVMTSEGFPGGSVVMSLPASAGNMGSIPGLGRSPGGGNDNPLEYSCLKNPMDRGAWWTTVCRFQSQTQFSSLAHMQ